ncbi:GNAT family N-acetyltransferase [Paenibacillus agricola]|uniref:GNAT family N-acetyltransferase n=1 Tax=Paenibacillus agricola TaxID=2716264 RepID=A0ABX0JH24_9BACL|nr:GNAT family N-acetyltransferase [Paenibacillus agricola]NHN34579.1 GNAT family N-acetyltransferase [Paenibacillus agricola]
MSSLDIRHIRKEHFLDSVALSAFAFQMELTPQQREERLARMSEQEGWGAYVDGKLAARLTLLDLHIWLHGKRFNMGGIAGVATWPEYRRGGLVAGLLHHSLQVMKDQGQTLSFLHPFQFGFYRKFGWETYCDYIKYEIPTALLPKLPAPPGRMVRVNHDMELLNPIYRSYATRYNGTLDRNEQWWQRRIFENRKGDIVAYYDDNGVASGYVQYEVKDRVCKIHELVALHYEAEKALWRFIADHDSMIEKVTLQAPADDRLPFLLDNPRIKQELVPYFMARIVDVAGFLEQFPFAANAGRVVQAGAGGGARAGAVNETAAGTRELVLKIKDAHAEWNNGSFVVKIDATGAASVEKLPEGSSIVSGAEAEGGGSIGSAGATGLSCDISTLAAIFMGYQQPSFLQRINRLQGSDEAVQSLEALLPQQQTYLADYF